MDHAREFIKVCVSEKHLTLLVPDKDADGLSSGKIMHHTLTSLGLPKDCIRVHMLAKSASVFQDSEREKMEGYGATRIIVMDQGSRGGPSLVSPVTPDGKYVSTLIIDHHESDEFPEGSLVVSACHSPPIVTSSLLTYLICLPLHPSIRDECAVPALLGVFGDLGPNVVKWNEPPWPSHLGDVVKKVTKKALSNAVSMMNAPRRTTEYQVHDAWEAVLKAKSLEDISRNRVFLAARARVNAEVERCTHVAPQFSKDGCVALLRIHSGYQIHPVIATRWAGYLRARDLQLVMVANDAYHPSGTYTNFSCRIISGLRKLPETERPNLIKVLKDYARKVPDEGFLTRVGGDFATGHKEATGGIIPTNDFEKFVRAMEIGVKPDPSNNQNKSVRKKTTDAGQKVKLTDYFSSTKP
ncbi:DHH phosphoesterase [Fomitiporia mediterranea MF3/22]|uniref:DHH phosphoesterase n=1 Tax=Fomitiporia mediterranea (strain MF3/22) TaxID=694068 RepID=UPI000440870A|nr:DHH phosphoesterase [Fomitiporia mediterranea MF3/22]EJD07456.1 DHH phosphoesterase [Fomitiporia mediterranea MF3/22]